MTQTTLVLSRNIKTNYMHVPTSSELSDMASACCCSVDDAVHEVNLAGLAQRVALADGAALALVLPSQAALLLEYAAIVVASVSPVTSCAASSVLKSSTAAVSLIGCHINKMMTS